MRRRLRVPDTAKGRRPCESSAGEKSGPWRAVGRGVLPPSLRGVLGDRDPPSRRRPRPHQHTVARGGRLPLAAGADAGCGADVVEGGWHSGAQASFALALVWRVAPRWYAVVLLGFPLLALVAVVIGFATSSHRPDLSASYIHNIFPQFPRNLSPWLLFLPFLL